MRHGRPVRASGRHRVVGVADAQQTGLQRDRFTGKSVGIAGTVPALVMVADPREDLHELRRHQDLLAQTGMLPDVAHLHGGKGTALAQHPV